MSNVVAFPKEYVIVEGGWLNGYPVDDPDGQIFFVIFRMEDGSEPVLWDGNSYDEAMREAADIAAHEGLRIFDRTEGAN